MTNKRIKKSKMIISILLKKIPQLYVKNIKDLIVKLKKYEGTIESLIDYLNNFYKSENDQKNKLDLSIINTKITDDNLKSFKNFIVNNIDNINYNANISNYGDSLERDISLTKKDLHLNNSESLLLFRCYNDFNNNYKINQNLLKKINKCKIFPKYKGNGDNKLLNNFRFLFDHSKYFKILDKLLTMELVEKLKKNNNMPNKDIYCANIDRIYSNSIKELAYDIVKSDDNYILIDISKAFDSLEFDFIERKLYSYLSKKLSLKDSFEITQKYMYLLRNRRCYFLNNKVKVSKGITTGLCSSAIIFTLLFDEIFTEYIEILKRNNIKLGVDYNLRIYMDDICIKLNKTDLANYIFDMLIKLLGFNRYKINKDKCKVSRNLDIPNVKKIVDGDFYLGLPFSSSIKNYLDIIFDQFKKKHINIDVLEIKRLLRLKKIYQDLPILDEITRKINGFFQYKLYGLNKYNLDVKSEDLINIINKYY